MILLAIILALVLGTGTARAQTTDFDSWLVLVVDVSGSVSAAEYDVQRQGYVKVLGDPMIQSALDRTAVAIVEFGTEAIVAIEWSDVRVAAAAYQAHERKSAGNTCVFCGIELALRLLDGKSGRRIIDISGDGIENLNSDEAVHKLRDMATVERIEINTLALLVGGDQATYGGYAGVGDADERQLENWYAELATGFAMAIATLEDLAYALRRKLFAEVAAYMPTHPLMRE